MRPLLKPKPSIPYSFLLSFVQGPSMTLDDPRNASSWANNTRTHGLLKSIPLFQSISPRDLDIYHLYGRSISSITSHTVKNFSKTFQTLFKQKHLLTVSGNACTLKQNTQYLQLKDSNISFFQNIFLKHVSGNACTLKQNTCNLRRKISNSQTFQKCM